MALITELDLGHLPLEEQAFSNDPLPYLEKAHRQHPWLAKSNIGFVVTEYTAMDEILRMDGKLRMSSAEIVDLMGARGTGWGKFTEEMMLSLSGSVHDRLRNSVASAFTPRAVNRLRPQIRTVISQLLDEWAPKGKFDFTEFAAKFPIQVMFALVGASVDQLPDIIESLEIHGSSYDLNASRMPIIEKAYQTLWRFVDKLVVDRGPNAGKGDLLDDLIAANTSKLLDDDELRIMLIFLFAAGYDTSKNLLSLLMNTMIDEPEIWKRCAKEREYCSKVVKEQLRFASPSNVYRFVSEEFEYRGVRFPYATQLILPLTISGRDAKAFSDANTFNPDRKDKEHHLAFGRGMHICLGQFLAVANVEEGVHLIAQRVTNPRHTSAAVWRPFPGVWGIKSLPIAFDPAPASMQLAS